MNLNKVYLSLGSNLGDKIKNLQSAINLIDTSIGDVLSISNVYKTKSEGFIGGDFFNCCISNEILLITFIEVFCTLWPCFKSAMNP